MEGAIGMIATLAQTDRAKRANSQAKGGPSNHNEPNTRAFCCVVPPRAHPLDSQSPPISPSPRDPNYTNSPTPFLFP